MPPLRNSPYISAMEANNGVLAELPRSELCIYLIIEELKSNKFFSILREAGLEGSIYQADLSEVVLKLAGFIDPPNQLSMLYFQLVETHSMEMMPLPDDMMKRANLCTWS
jgi:hypothetical protein